MSHVYNKTHCETNIAFNYYYHYFFMTRLVYAEVEPGSALKTNVQELALFMGVATTIHLIR